MLDLNCHNFGIQEYSIPPQRTVEMFPGFPEVRDGMMWPNGKPGLGIDIDEDMAAKFPHKPREFGGAWGHRQARRRRHGEAVTGTLPSCSASRADGRQQRATFRHDTLYSVVL